MDKGKTINPVLLTKPELSPFNKFENKFPLDEFGLQKIKS